MSKRPVLKRKSTSQNKNKGILTPVIIAGATVVILIGLIIVIDFNQKTSVHSDYIETSAANTDTNPQALEVVGDDGLNIIKSDLSQTVKFYQQKVDNVKMGVLAVKLKDGTIKVAMDTCESCYSSGRGYFKQVGDHLVCQNCGNSFSFDNIGMQLEGCNPVPIPNSSLTVGDNSVTISKAFLVSNKNLFSNWKK